jgi:hypothetical protein
MNPPRTLAAFLVMVITGMIKNARGMVKSVIKGMIISFVIVLILHTLLQVMNRSNSDLQNSVLAVTGLQSSPNALLFWFLLTAIITFFWSQITGRGLRPTVGKITSLPTWISSAARTTGMSAVPLVMSGVAIALIIRLCLLTTLTSIQFLIMMFGILYSQQESLTILALRLGYSDILRAVKKTGPSIPATGFPVMGVVGACAGFLFVVFYADTLLEIVIVIAIMVVVAFLIQYRKKKTLSKGLNISQVIDGHQRGGL